MAVDSTKSFMPQEGVPVHHRPVVTVEVTRMVTLSLKCATLRSTTTRTSLFIQWPNTPHA